LISGSDDRLEESGGAGDEDCDRRPEKSFVAHPSFPSFAQEHSFSVTSAPEDDNEADRAAFGFDGGARGVINLSAGFIVLTSVIFIESMEPLRSRGGETSTGSQRILTG